MTFGNLFGSKRTENFKMVPRVGIEPTRLSAADFESAASANSATRAMIGGASDPKGGPEASPQWDASSGRR